ncbi:MAG: type II secretion system F family protein [Deltaproteobacteria bacterium]|nr:type II secretion system F family protein [Deltaproteobacteria bacterium]
MDRTAIIIIAGLVAGVSLLGMIYILFFASRRDSTFSRLRGGGLEAYGSVAEMRERLKSDPSGVEYERLKQIQNKSLQNQKVKLTLDDLYYQAGIFTARDQREFNRLRILMPAVLTPLVSVTLFWSMGPQLGLLGIPLGLAMGLQAPRSILNRRIARRADDILFFLPLVIEQIAIGVSSSLDIGPCLQRVIAMADERDSHNVVTELIRHAQYHVKSGVSLEEALTEVGNRSGNAELKHAFVALAQVAKHGGEISKQLQELANAVSSQRETKIDAKIRKLELEATGPVALVFLGFILILLIGFGIQIKKGF